jgi:hypothetical protein
MRNPRDYFKTSPEVMRLAVMMYVRFPLSLRQVEDLLDERGIDICHETVRASRDRLGNCLLPRSGGSVLPRTETGHIGGGIWMKFSFGSIEKSTACGEWSIMQEKSLRSSSQRGGIVWLRFCF